MLFQTLRLLTVAPVIALTLLASFVVAMVAGLSFHEFSHAMVADSLGDRTPRRAGRLTLDPRAHLDPMGALFVLLAGFGWAKPTPVNPWNTQHPRLSMVLIGLGGPVSNLVLAGLVGLPFQFGVLSVVPLSFGMTALDYVALFLFTILQINVLLAVFNLLPLAPLDGFRVLVGLLPDDLGREFSRFEPWGIGVLMLLVFLPLLTNGAFNPLFAVMGPLIHFFVRLFAGHASGGLLLA